MSNFQELITNNLVTLQEELSVARQTLLKLRFRHATDQLKDYSQLGKTKRQIAQLLTIINFHKRAIIVAKELPQVKSMLLTTQKYTSSAEFQYDKNIWRVSFQNDKGQLLDTVNVKL